MTVRRALLPAMLLAAAPFGQGAHAQHRSERIEPVFDLPDRPPFQLGTVNLDIGYLFPVRADGETTIGMYRDGRYVLFGGTRHLPTDDRLLALIEQNIGQDPLRMHRARRSRILAGLPAAGVGRRSAEPAEGRQGSTAPRRSTVGRMPQADLSDDTAGAQATPVEAVDDTMLAAATVVIALVLAGVRLARATSSSNRAPSRNRGQTPGGGGDVGARLRRWTVDVD